MDRIAIGVDTDPAPEDLAAVIEGLARHNATRARSEDVRPIAAFARLDGAIVGGVDGRTHWRWLHVRHLWVADRLRGVGVGTRLVRAVEDGARDRGCGAVWLDTFSFQARPFYLSLGYRDFGELADFPPGDTRHFLWKPL